MTAGHKQLLHPTVLRNAKPGDFACKAVLFLYLCLGLSPAIGAASEPPNSGLRWLDARNLVEDRKPTVFSRFGSRYLYNSSANHNDGQKGLMMRKAGEILIPAESSLPNVNHSVPGSVFQQRIGF